MLGVNVTDIDHPWGGERKRSNPPRRKKDLCLVTHGCQMGEAPTVDCYCYDRSVRYFVELGSIDGAKLGTSTHIESSRLYSKYEARVSGMARSLMPEHWC